MADSSGSKIGEPGYGFWPDAPVLWLTTRVAPISHGRTASSELMKQHGQPRDTSHLSGNIVDVGCHDV